MPALKVESFGTRTVAILPEEMLSRMQVEPGGTLFAVESGSGYLLTSVDPEITEQVEVGRSIMTEYRETYKKLAE